MRLTATRFVCQRVLPMILLLLASGAYTAAQATITTYVASLSGSNESPPNASPGAGSAQVDLDDVANTMHVHIVFSSLVLTGTGTTASHIHAPTASPGTGTAGVATTTPYFAGFPIGVRAGTFDITLDMTQSSSYNPSYVSANGGTPASAEAALFAAIAAGKAYVNIHSNSFPGGEIRGFLLPQSVPTRRTSWGRIKVLYSSSPTSSLQLAPSMDLGGSAAAPSAECCAGN